MLLRLFLLLALLMISLTVFSQNKTTYKCVDATGAIQYSALLIEGADCTSMRVRRGPSQDTEQTAAEATVDEKQAEDEKTAETTEKPQTAEAQRTANCATARKNMELLKGDSKLVRLDDDGKEVPLQDENRAEALKQADKGIKYWCN